jgi:hypothetical protein
MYLREFTLTRIQLAVFLAALDVVSDPFGLSGRALSFLRPLHGTQVKI